MCIWDQTANLIPAIYMYIWYYAYCRKLKDQWDDKMEVLNRLEQSMADVQGSFKEKEATLTKERDKAMENAR